MANVVMEYPVPTLKPEFLGNTEFDLTRPAVDTMLGQHGADQAEVSASLKAIENDIKANVVRVTADGNEETKGWKQTCPHLCA